MKATKKDPSPQTPEPAFTDFFRARYVEVLLFAWHYAGSGLDVENLVAEAFARACAWWPTIDDPRPWVYRTVINLITDAGRESQRSSPSGDPYKDHGASSRWKSGAMLPGVEWGAQLAEISWALQQLPGQQRAAVLLDYRGWTGPQIAAALECTPITVRGHLHRGRARLRELLGEPQRTKQQAPSTGLEGRTA